MHRLALQQAQRERRLRKVPEPRRAIAVNLQGWVAARLVYVDANCSFALCTEACVSCWHTCVQEKTLWECVSSAGRCSRQLAKGHNGSPKNNPKGGGGSWLFAAVETHVMKLRVARPSMFCRVCSAMIGAYAA